MARLFRPRFRPFPMPIPFQRALIFGAISSFFLVGCRQNPATHSNSISTPPQIAPKTPSAPAKTPIQSKPTAKSKTYQITPASAQRFGPKAPPNFVQPYLQAMKKLAVAPPPVDFKVPDRPRVIFQTSKGQITLQLDAQAAPLHVKSFLYLAGKKFYDGTTFHNILKFNGKKPAQIVEGGDPLTINPVTRRFAGLGGPGYQIPLEKSALKHDQFVIAAMRSNALDSAGSQFYITQTPLHSRDKQYTVFGKVVAGTEVVSKLAMGDKLLKVQVLDAKAA